MVDATIETVETGAESVIWDLTPLYAGTDDPQIQAEMDEVASLIDTFAESYRGKVGELDSEELIDALKEVETIQKYLIRLYSYASLVYSTDTSDAQAGALMAKVQQFGAQVGQKLVFLRA